MNTKNLQKDLQRFAEERDWDQFHSPKNLAMAIAIESSELMELFQWCNDTQSFSMINSKTNKQRVEEEIADVFLYILRFADKFDIDLEKVAKQKLTANRRKYPIALCRGKATKYDKLLEEEFS